MEGILNKKIGRENIEDSRGDDQRQFCSENWFKATDCLVYLIFFFKNSNLKFESEQK